MHERQFAARIITALNERELSAHIAHRLMMARECALEAATGASAAGRNTLVLTRQSLVGLAAALVLLLAGVAWYANDMSESDMENPDLDAAVLSGDLPVHAYLDRGFAAYLHRAL